MGRLANALLVGALLLQLPGAALAQQSAPVEAMSPPVEPAPPWWKHSVLLRWGGTAVAIAGAGVIATGAVFGAEAESVRGAALPSTGVTQVEGIPGQQRANDLAGAANVMLGVGISTVAIGGLAVLWDRINAPDDVPATSTSVSTVAETKACLADEDCASSQVCDQQVCAVVKVVETERGTFSIYGTVVDAVSGEGIGNARVSFGRMRSSPLSTAPGTGAFESFPLPAGDGAVRVIIRADGYDEREVVVARGSKDARIPIDVRLTPTGHVVTGQVRGTVRDGRSGKPVKARVFVASIGRNVKPTDGAFEVDLPPGKHEVLVSAKGYVTQRKRFTIHSGAEVVLNIDLAPARTDRPSARARCVDASVRPRAASARRERRQAEQA